jgi:hypothetical protein
MCGGVVGLGANHCFVLLRGYESMLRDGCTGKWSTLRSSVAGNRLFERIVLVTLIYTRLSVAAHIWRDGPETRVGARSQAIEGCRTTWGPAGCLVRPGGRFPRRMAVMMAGR